LENAGNERKYTRNVLGGGGKLYKPYKSAIYTRYTAYRIHNNNVLLDSGVRRK
jgi:hypothetical protein